MNHNINIGIAYMIGAQSILAIMAACVRALKTLPLMEIVFLRSLTGMIFVGSYMLLFNISFQGKQHFDLCMRGVIGLMALASYYYAITQLGLSTATLLANTSPLWVVGLAGIFLQERVSLKVIMLIALSLVGVLILVKPEFNDNVMGYTVGLTAAFFIALSFLYLRKLKNENSFLVVFYFVTISSLGSAPWAFTEWIQPSLEQWSLVLVIAISTFFGQICLTRSFQYGQVSVISAVGYIGPALCWLLGLYFFDEVVTTHGVLGAVIILLSGITLTLFAKEKKGTSLKSRKLGD